MDCLFLLTEQVLPVFPCGKTEDRTVDVYTSRKAPAPKQLCENKFRRGAKQYRRPKLVHVEDPGRAFARTDDLCRVAPNTFEAERSSPLKRHCEPKPFGSLLFVFFSASKNNAHRRWTVETPARSHWNCRR